MQKIKHWNSSKLVLTHT